jgi:hypothetical protein
MEMRTWLFLAGICMIYVALGFWAVSQIFPSDRAAAPRSDPATDTTTPASTKITSLP